MEEPYTEDNMWSLRHDQIFRLIDDSNITEQPFQLEAVEEDPTMYFRRSYWKQSTFIKLVCELVLASDAITHVKLFYQALATACQASHANSRAILPDFQDLRIDMSIRDIMMPDINSGHYHEAKLFIDSVGQSIQAFLRGPSKEKIIPYRKCQNVRVLLDTCMSNCGLDMLDAIMKGSIPRLGANVDILSEITSLQIQNGETLANFVTRCSERHQTMVDSGINTISPNLLMSRMLNLLTPHSQLMPHIFELTSTFNRHQKRLPNSTFKENPVHALLTALNDSGANLHQRLNAGGGNERRVGNLGQNSRTNNGGLRNERRGFNSTPRFSKPQVNNIAVDDISQHEQEEYQQLNDTHNDDQPSQEELELECAQAEFLQFLADTDEALVNAIDSYTERCLICEDKHSTTKCHYLHERNIPLTLKRRIAQARLRYKNYIQKLDAMTDQEQQAQQDTQPPPQPKQPNLQPKQGVKFDNPAISTITPEQKYAINEHLPTNGTNQECTNNNSYEPSQQEIENFKALEDIILSSTGGTEDELSTPFAANIQVPTHQREEKKDAIVPIYPEWEDDLEPSDYYAYAGLNSNF